MIITRDDLNKVLSLERELYLGKRKFCSVTRLRLTNENLYWIWRYVYYLRKCEYYLNSHNMFMLFLARRRKNKIGQILSIEIKENCFDIGLRIFHGNIVVNENAIIGKNCKLHGNNCIGNNGKVDINPIIGDNFDLGVGAVVLGNIRIGSNVTIGANSTVVKNISDNCIVVGSPGKTI